MNGGSRAVRTLTDGEAAGHKLGSSVKYVRHEVLQNQGFWFEVKATAWSYANQY